MADWNQPTLTSTYADFLTFLAARDTDTFTMGLSTVTNPPTGALRYDRAGNKFQEWNGSAWVDKILGIAGGGTGSATGISLGTMASQNANNVAITGGSITGLNSFGVNGTVTFSGAITASSTLGVAGRITAGEVVTSGLIQSGGYLQSVDGRIFLGGGSLQLTQAGTGKIFGLTGTYFADLNGNQITNLNGSAIGTGTVPTARLGSGTPSADTVLKGDGTWGVYGMVRRIVTVNVSISVGSGLPGYYDIGLPVALDNYTFAAFSFVGNSVNLRGVALVSNTAIRVTTTGNSNDSFAIHGTFCITEYKNVG